MNNISRPSGIVVHKDGTTAIPASDRGDGSKRNPIRVRPGFTPTEDIAKYRPAKTRSVLPQEPSERRSAAPSTSSPNIVQVRNSTPSSPRLGHESSSLAPQAKSGTSKQVKSSWSDAGWRGTSDAPSRFARAGDASPLQINDRTTRSITRKSVLESSTIEEGLTSKEQENELIKSATNVSESDKKGSELDIDEVETRLRSVKLISKTDK